MRRHIWAGLVVLCIGAGGEARAENNAEVPLPPVVPTPGERDHRLGVFAREHVQLELFAPMGADEARVLLVNRRDVSVLVEYTVEVAMGDPRTYLVDLQAKETRGDDGRFVVPTGGQPRPRAAIVRVNVVPIEEGSGYVRLAEDREDRVTVSLFRPETGGNLVYAVLINNDDRAVTVTWEARGLIGGEPQRFTTDLAARAVAGRDGRITLPYKPIHDPRFRTRPRIHIIDVIPQRR